MSTEIEKVPGTLLIAPKFYHYSQNNSGGKFAYDAFTGITHHVVIQAFSVEDANNRAEAIGIYFDGCANGRDCDCCGDRWYSMWDEKSGTDLPEVYGEPVDAHTGMMWMEAGREIAVHFLDGTITWYGKKRR